MSEPVTLAEAIRKLSPFQAWVIQSRFGLGKEPPSSLVDMHELCGLSLYRLRQVERTALDRLAAITQVSMFELGYNIGMATREQGERA